MVRTTLMDKLVPLQAAVVVVRMIMAVEVVLEETEETEVLLFLMDQLPQELIKHLLFVTFLQHYRLRPHL